MPYARCSYKRRRSLHLWCFLLFLGRQILVRNYKETRNTCNFVYAALRQFVPSRDRLVKARQKSGKYTSYRDNGRPIEGPNYHRAVLDSLDATYDERNEPKKDVRHSLKADSVVYHNNMQESMPVHRRAGQYTSCCSKFLNYSASDLCSLYNQDCTSGKAKSHDDGNSYCTQQGLAFIGLSFSVQTKKGNPNSYQLCDQFPMENLIDRDYKYVMSMDEDGWLVGGGYKQFDYSGKMPYIDSSHTELLRIGSMDVSKGGTSIQQVYKAMSTISFEPFPIYPEYLKGGGGHRHEKEGERGGSHDKEGSRDKEENRGEHRRRARGLKENENSGSTPSGDITLIVSVVEVYSGSSAYSTYQTFINELFEALENVDQGSCVDDHDTDPHVSMARGVKFKSSYHMQQYMNAANLEVAVWQAMYPKGVIIGSGSYASFPLDGKGKKSLVGYGNLYFFFDRMNITKAFPPSRRLSDEESYYATLYQKGKASKFYRTVDTAATYDNEDEGDSWEYNPYYQWKTNMAIHDQTNGWDLPPNCNEEGETFLGIPLSRKSKSNLQITSTFQKQFDFEYLLDRNFTYIIGHGTNHGWLVGGEVTGNGAGSLVDKDTAHIPVFYLGTTNPKMGGMSLSDMIKVLKTVQFGTLYIKPAFVFADSNGHLKLQFEADPSSSMGYLYDNLCQMLGVKWNNISSYNSLGLYTNCAMHAAGDRAAYGCGPTNGNSGGFCPQMTIAYSPRFKSQDAAASYIAAANNYVDYWRSLYPYGVAVGTDHFCKSKSSSGYKGGCLGLFLNRMDLYYVLAPDLSGAWVQFNGNSIAPTHSPAPTFSGGCDDPRNFHLDICFRIKYSKQYAPEGSGWWSSLGMVGQLTLIAACLLSTVFVVALFVAQSRKQKKRALKKFFSSRRRKKRGDKALLIMEERCNRKGEYRERSRSSRRSRSGKIHKPFLCAALDLGTEDETCDSNNSTSYDPPKIQEIADLSSNNSDVDSSSFPSAAQPTANTHNLTSEMSRSERMSQAHAAASTIDLTKTLSNVSKKSRSSRTTTKPISFHQWLVKELNARDEVATNMDATSSASSGINDARLATSSSAAMRSVREKSTTAFVSTKTSGNTGGSNLLAPPKSLSSYPAVVEESTEEIKRPPTRPTATIQPLVNIDSIAVQKLTTTADVDVTRNISNFSNLSASSATASKGGKASKALAYLKSITSSGIGEAKEPLKDPMKYPAQSFIPRTEMEPGTNTGCNGLQHCSAKVNVDLTRTSSSVSKISGSNSTASSKEKAPNAIAFLKSRKSARNFTVANLRKDDVNEQPSYPARTFSNSPKDPEHQSQSTIPNTEVEPGTNSHHSTTLADVHLTRTSSHVPKMSMSNTTVSSKGKAPKAQVHLESRKSTHTSNSGIVKTLVSAPPTEAKEHQAQSSTLDLNTGPNHPQCAVSPADIDLTRTSSQLSKMSRSNTTISSKGNVLNAFLNQRKSKPNSNSFIEESEQP